MHALKLYVALTLTQKSYLVLIKIPPSFGPLGNSSYFLAFFLLGYNHPGFHSILRTHHTCTLRAFALAAFSFKISIHSLHMVSSHHSNFYLNALFSGSLFFIIHYKLLLLLCYYHIMCIFSLLSETLVGVF